MAATPTWLRLLFALFPLAALWGGFELLRLDAEGGALARAACLEANRTARSEAAQAAAAGEAAAALAALARVGECPSLPAWPWALLGGGLAGLGLAFVLREITGRLARLEAARPPAAVGAPIAPPERRAASLPRAEPAATPAPPAAPAPGPEDELMIRLVTEEMRAQGLNISPEVARHVAALRAGRAEG